jgi:hypothetical protein
MSDSDGTDFSPIAGEAEYTDQYGHDVHVVTHQDGTTDQYSDDNHGGFQQMHIDPTSGTTQEGVTADGYQFDQNLDTNGTLTDGEYADAQGDTASVDLQSDGTYSSEADMANGEHVSVTNMQNPEPNFGN